MARSVWVHLRDANEADITAWLDGFAERWTKAGAGERPRWAHPHTGECVLSIEFDELTDWDPDDFPRIAAAVGAEGWVSVVADVSGRVPGRAEALAFVTGLLRRFGGVAYDGYSMHLHFWTLDEIERDAVIEGFRFLVAPERIEL